MWRGRGEEVWRGRGVEVKRGEGGVEGGRRRMKRREGPSLLRSFAHTRIEREIQRERERERLRHTHTQRH